MDPLTIGLLAGAGLGLVKGGVLDKDKEKRDRKMQAEIARYSPWSGMSAQPVQQADMLGSTMQGAMGGAMLGQGIGAATAAAPAAGAAGGAAGGGAMSMADPAAQASMAGGQSAAAGAGAYPGAATYNAQMAAKYPWLGMR